MTPEVNLDLHVHRSHKQAYPCTCIPTCLCTHTHTNVKMTSFYIHGILSRWCRDPIYFSVTDLQVRSCYILTNLPSGVLITVSPVSCLYFSSPSTNHSSDLSSHGNSKLNRRDFRDMLSFSSPGWLGT